jgi:hypothetical protein
MLLYVPETADELADGLPSASGNAIIDSINSM